MRNLGKVRPSPKSPSTVRNLVGVKKQLNISKNITSCKMEDELYSLAERAMDVAIVEKKFFFKLYDFLHHNKAKRKVATEFLESSTAHNIEITITELEEYIKGGSDADHKYLREAYHHIGKPEARKIAKYLHQIIDDAKRYEFDKRPGRRKKTVNK